MWKLGAGGIIVALLASLDCMPQTTEGLITGVITESSGKPVSGAEVLYANSDLGSKGAVRSSGNGSYFLPLLSPGHYRIRVACDPDYQPQEIQELELHVAARLEVDFTLQRWSELSNPRGTFSPFGTVVVSYYAADVESLKPVAIRLDPSRTSPLQTSLSQVMTGRDLRDLPLNGRDAYTLLVLQPSVTADTTTSRGLGLAINGQRPASSNYLLDGIENNNSLITGPLTAVAPEAIQEYRVSLSSFSAEYGGTSGVLANAITRAGGNSWHGIGYFNLKNDVLNANDFQANRRGQPRSPLKEGQYGFHVGGPIWPAHLFASASYERLRSRGYQDSVSLKIPAPDLVGSFSNTNPGKKLFSLFPAPANGPGDGTLSTLNIRPPVAIDRHFGVVRLDESPPISNRRFFARVAVNHFSAPDFIWSPYKDFISPLDQPLIGVALGYIEEARASGANEVRFGWNRNTIRWDRAHPEIPTLTIAQNLRGPDDTVSTASQPTILPGSLAFYGFRQTNWNLQANDTWTLLTSRHIFKAGGGLLFRHSDGLLTAGRDGRYVFNDIFSFLINEPSTFSISVDRNKLPGLAIPTYDRAYRMRQFSLFAEDTWRVTPRLVLNGGIRYENFGSPVNTGAFKDTELVLGTGSTLSDRLTTARFSAPPGGNQELYPPDGNNFAVRAGASYALNSSGRTLLRGGYGIFFDRPFDNLWLNAANNSFVTATFDCTLSGNCQNYLNPVVSILPTFQTQRFTKDFPNLTALDSGLQTAYSRNYFAGIQQEVAGGWLVELNALGAFGRELVTTDVINRADTKGVRSRPDLYDISYRGNQGFSDYNAFTALLSRRWRRSYAQVAYTWSHAIDNQSDPLSGDFFDLSFVNFNQRAPARRAEFTRQFDSAADRENADFDQRQNLVFYSYWDLPSPFRSEKVAALTRNWLFSTVGAFRTGFPFSVFAPSSGAIVNQRANIVDPSHTVVDQPASGGKILLSPGGFARPSPGVVGNSGRNAFRGPGLYNLDFSVSRAFAVPRLSEGGRFTIRADFFNALNHANLNNPDSLISSSTFGLAQFGRQGFDTGFPAISPLKETARQIQLILRLEF